MPYLSFIIASASHVRTFASQGLTPQIVISYPISSHLHHICASSYLRFLSQISTSSLSSSGLDILRPHLVFTRSDLHRRVALSLSYHLQDFIMQLLSQLYNLIYLRLQNFISPRSRANRRLVEFEVQLRHLPVGITSEHFMDDMGYPC